MSGMDLQLNLTDLASLHGLVGLLDPLIQQNTDELLDTLGAGLERQTFRRIAEEKTSPDGQPWADWSERYAETRRSGHNVLQNEGDLLDDIRYQVSGSEIEVGTNLDYAATHQFGDATRGIPERAYLGISADNRDELEVVVDNWLLGLIGGAA